jgi:hypothetical protein
MSTNIDLGYMSIENGEWSGGNCFCEYEKNGSKCRPCKDNLKADEIVIPFQDVTVIYDYPFKDNFPHEHHTENKNGFTRSEISEQIMARYAEMYQEEDKDVGHPTGTVNPQMLNRARSDGRYGIWGHDIGDLQLHSLYKSKTKATEFYIGVDS